MSVINWGSTDTIFSVAYLLVSFCFVTPPVEFIQAGFTVQSIFGNFLGSEDLNFVYYHIYRTTITLLVHSCLPLGYYIGYGLFTENKSHNILNPASLPLSWRYFLLVSLILPFCATILALYWKRNRFANHPIAKSLQVIAPQGSTWQAIASSINIEFRRIDKFTTGLPGRRLIVTDSWIMKTSTYFVYTAHQRDIHLSLEAADNHDISHEGSTGSQYINIMVRNINTNAQSFPIRLNAMEYQDLKDKVQSPLINARNVVIHQSISDRFLHAFREQIDRNQRFTRPSDMELESCIGCMQTQANVKLQKLCDNPEEGTCVGCFCRPMWCTECMGKWYASRQDQNKPEEWMAGKSPCPTCRSKFCMLDVCKVI